MAFGLFNLFKKKNAFGEEDLLFPKVDLHVHLLPGVDDGSQDEETSLLMMHAALKCGVVHCNATAHYRSNLMPTPEEVAEAFQKIRKIKEKEGLPLSFSCSQEIEYFPGAENFIQGNRLACVGKNLRYSLLEFTRDINRQAALAIVFQLGMAGITPIIVHPERFDFIQRHPEVAEELRHRGAFLLLNATSLVGFYGRLVEETALTLLDKGEVDGLASDAHGPEYYKPYLAGCRLAAERQGLEKLYKYTWSFPCRVLGYEPETAEADYDPFAIH